jgi:thiamine-phosphate pyrophosphorylase
MPTAAARKLLGPERLIGVSTHSVEEISTAAVQGADFVTFGPVFHTPSKAAYGAPAGLEKLRRACSGSSIPVYGLGGINPANAASVQGAGACGVALISALLNADAPTSTCRKLLKTLNI